MFLGKGKKVTMEDRCTEGARKLRLGPELLSVAVYVNTNTKDHQSLLREAKIHMESTTCSEIFLQS